jgi:hypothetical protein
VVATCTNSLWSIPTPVPNNCSSLPGPGCPATFQSVPPGSACPTSGLLCDYPQGRCACTTPLSGPPIITLDGAVPIRWACQNPGQNCPRPRPLLGRPCTQNGLFCDYGGCTVPGGTSEQCTGGVWQPALTACPAVAGASTG